MSRPRLAATLLLAAGGLLAAAPSSWADPPQGAWTSPAPAAVVDGVPVGYLEAPQKLQGYAQFDQGVAGVAFALTRDAASPEDPCSAATHVRPQSSGGGDGRVDFAFDAPFPCNRRYQVRATVAPKQDPLQQSGPLVLDLWVAVAIPTAPTTGLQGTLTPTRTVALRWDAAAREPDFQGFEIRRAEARGDFRRIGEVGPGATTFTDAAVPAAAGVLRYEAVGLRPGPDAGTTVFADPGRSVTILLPAGPAPAGATGGSGTATGAAPARAPSPTVVAPEATTPTTADSGFQERLPFKVPAPAPVPKGDPAVVARLPADDGDQEGHRRTLLLVAGAGTAFSWAMALRFLAHRAAPI